MKLDADLFARRLRRVGWPGAAAMAILAGTAWNAWVVAPEIAGETAALHAQALEERERKAVLRPVNTASTVLDAFYARLPDDRLSNATLAEILQGAKSWGLTVGAVQFRSGSTRLPGVVRHQVHVPIQGRYDALRAWIATTLREHPGVSLDSIDIKRKDAMTSDLGAQLTLSVWASTSHPASAAREVAHGY